VGSKLGKLPLSSFRLQHQWVKAPETPKLPHDRGISSHRHQENSNALATTTHCQNVNMMPRQAYAPTPHSYVPNTSLSATINLDEVTKGCPPRSAPRNPSSVADDDLVVV